MDDGDSIVDRNNVFTREEMIKIVVLMIDLMGDSNVKLVKGEEE